MKLTKLTDWLAPVRDNLRQVRDAEQSKRSEYEEAITEKQRLLTQKAPRAELMERLEEEIASLGQAWAAGRPADLVACLSGTIHVTPQGTVEGLLRSTNICNVVGELLHARLVRAHAERRAGRTRQADRGPRVRGRRADDRSPAPPRRAG